MKVLAIDGGGIRGLTRRALGKAWRKVRREQVIQRNWEAQFLPQQGRARLADNLLSPGLRLHNVIAPNIVQRLFDDFYANPQRESGYAVSMLLTFAAWLERYG